MRRKLWMSSAAGLLGTLLYAAPALAANPAQDAYGAVSGATSGTGTGATASAAANGTLPFTGLNLVAILAVAIILLTVGVIVRVRAARSH